MGSTLAALAHITMQRATPAFDADEFLVNSACWTQEVAQAIAHAREIALVTPEHWAILAFLRDYHSRFSAVPPLRCVSRVRKLPRGALNRLFGTYIEAWRIAGLPNPGEEAKTYMSGNTL